MRIVIDLQGAQTDSRFRGIGRYTMSLTQAIVRNKGEHEIILALNGMFPDTIEPIRTAFNALLPQENIRVWYASGPVKECEPGNDWRREVAELIREAFLASLSPDVIHINSFFEGYVDDAVTSIGRFDRTTPVSVTLHDLIPLLHQEHYFKPNPAFAQHYQRKIEDLKRATIWLAISESSRQEGLIHLDASENRIFNTSEAAEPYFRPLKIPSTTKEKLRRKYGLTRPFVMYTGGIDYRKNIEGLIRAFSCLPDHLRHEHQLAIVCSARDEDKHRLWELAKEQTLTKEDVVLTGFVPEKDLIALYNLCKLFVFPSWHEGFGLPALEAMQCGAPVIGSNTTSIPELIGLEEALFDPHSEKNTADKIEQALSDEVFRTKLIQNSHKQSKLFSWDKSAQRAIHAMETLYEKRDNIFRSQIVKGHKKKLAYVSPLPPERSGIADYSAELLPELSQFYEIEVIVKSDLILDAWIKANFPIRSVQWFFENYYHYESVLYHFGNSEFHEHMFDLLKAIPGVVVLHDFFLSGILAYMDSYQRNSGYWTQELFRSHGYKALYERYHTEDIAEVIWKYPCSLGVIQNSLGFIVHSANSLRLAEKCYGGFLFNSSVVPLLRNRLSDCNKIGAQKSLGCKTNDFLVCSFGMLGPTKLNHRLLQAWLKSSLAHDKKCYLIFVGENDSGEYGQKLLKTIRGSQGAKNIRISGWVDAHVYRNYLNVADVGVQLRTKSRGETSAAVLDCMNYGLATIVNANGSMADIDEKAVWKLPDEFPDEQLIEALETLRQDETIRRRLGEAARAVINCNHDPRSCAEQYRDNIERFYRSSASIPQTLSTAIAGLDSTTPNETELVRIADAIARSIPQHNGQRQILVDISEIVQRDVRSGIQRVVRSILKEWLSDSPLGYRIEPVYATVDRGYRYARRFVMGFLDCPNGVLQDEPIEYAIGDIFLGLDLQPQVVPAQRPFYQELRRQGIRVFFVVYDMLCVQMPQYFYDGAAEGFKRWLEVITESDGAICISKAVADELVYWVKKNSSARQRPFKIDWFHLGADVDNSIPTEGLPDDSEKVFDLLRSRSSFLMVGTLEPRKGHAQVLEAFTHLWQSGYNLNLIIVGKKGWMVENLIERLRSHPEFGKRLVWLEGISDEYLEKIYAASTCLIAASEGEGFGLPLIEAAQHNLPIIIRDIPVFREVAGDHAFYFRSGNGSELAQAIKDWCGLYAEKRAPLSDGMPHLTWKQSAERLMQICILQ